MNKKSIFLLPQLIVVLCFLIFSPSFGQATVWLTVEDGTGLPGTHNREVKVSLDNSVTVKSVEMYVCDVDNYLHCTGCETTERTSSGFTCGTVEIGGGDHYGCVNVGLIGGSITPGEGPIFILKYNVKSEAPEGECRALNPEDVVVRDENYQSLNVELEPGQFCFKCTSDEECDDGNYCNGDEFCDVDGVCQKGDEPCPDDGLYCSGYEVCLVDQCYHTWGGTPLDYPNETVCDPLVCDEGKDSCYCDADDQCIDGLYCNGGEEGCDEENGICQPEGNPCTPPYVCDEGNIQCVMSDVTLEVGDGKGYPEGWQDNLLKLSLENPNHLVFGIGLDICDEGYHLTCTECEATDRTTGFECVAKELLNGCCNITLLDPGCTLLIAKGTGPVCTIKYDVSKEIPPGCIPLSPENILVAGKMKEDDPLEELWVLPVSGEFCDECEGDFDCDGDVDGDDVTLFVIDIGRNMWNNPCTNESPCNGDFDCDGDVDGDDVTTFVIDIGRNMWNNPCAPCSEGYFCIYE